MSRPGLLSFLLMVSAAATASATGLVVSESADATGAVEFQLVVLEDGAGFGDMLSGEIMKTYPVPEPGDVRAGGATLWNRYREKVSPEGTTHTFYEQRYAPSKAGTPFKDGVPANGVKISGGYLAYHATQEFGVYLVAGTVYDEIDSVRKPVITSTEDAVFAAADRASATRRLRVDHGLYGRQGKLSELRSRTELWLHPVKGGGTFGYVWHVPVLTDTGGAIPVFLDAESGEILHVSESPRWDNACNPDTFSGQLNVTGTPQRTFLGTFFLTATPSSAGGERCGNAFVPQTAVTPSIQILRGALDDPAPCATGLNYTQVYAICSGGTGSTVYNNVEIYNPLWGGQHQCTPGRQVTDAMRHALTTFDVFWSVLGRQGIGGSGEEFRMVVDARCPPGDPVSSFERYGRNDAPENSVRICGLNADPPVSPTPLGCSDYDNVIRPAAALDIMAHEIGHGVVFNTTGLNYVYNGIEGALHEGFADIFGHGVEWMQTSYRPGEEPDWTLGEDFEDPPTRRSDADCGTLRFFYSDVQHDGSPHAKGSLLPVGMRLLAVGGTNPSCEPAQSPECPTGSSHNQPSPNDCCFVSVGSLDVETAFKVYYRMLDEYVFPSTTWLHMTGYAIAAAGQIEGYVNPPPTIGRGTLQPWCLKYSEYRYKAWQSMAAVELPGNITFCTSYPD